MLRVGLPPLDDLDDQQFETFLLLFLNAAISLNVIASCHSDSGQPTSTTRHRIISATKYGGPGRAGQRGIDILARTDNGSEWAFQCKHYKSKFNAAKTKAALAKAETEYPAANRYFLVLSGEPAPNIRDIIKASPNWEIWGASELSARFFNEVPRGKQIEILRRVFPTSSTAVIAKLYPQHDDLLIDTDSFFVRFLDPANPFNHVTTLVGRTTELQTLHAFVHDPESQALILPASGGIGKTRLLRAFGESFPQAHATKRLYFIDPNTRPDTQSDHLRAAIHDEIVVIHDDAHRSESLRADICTSILEKRGKLIFATLPHAVDSLVGWLGQIGFNHSRIHVLDTLKPLPHRELIALARACLPPIKSDLAEPLADLAKGCTLIVTVGAQLVTKTGLHPSQYLTDLPTRSF
jgi:hypothetical protein